MTTGMFLLILIALALNARDASGVIVYRIGAPFTAAEKDSLEGLSIDFRDIAWSASQFEEALEPDSLQAGSAAQLLRRGRKHRCDALFQRWLPGSNRNSYCLG